MSEVTRYACLDSGALVQKDQDSEGPFYILETDFNELRQQLADVSNERDILRNQRNQALERIVELTLDESSIYLQAKLNASEARNADLCALLQMFIDNSDDGDVVELSRHALAHSAPATDKPWAEWSVGDTVRYVGAGHFHHDRMMIGSDYLVHEAPDEEETFLVLDDDGDELCVLVGEFEFVAPVTDEQGAV